MAGVSVTAVSRVMNKSNYVAMDKKVAILKAVDQLGYRPNPVAVAMQNRSTKQILFYSKDLGNAFNIDMYRGMISYASQFDYMVILSGTWDIEKIKKIPVDGVILPNELISEEYLYSVKNTMQLPTVSASYGSSRLNKKHIPQVEADTYVAMEMLIDFLFSKGHKKIALATPYPIADDNPRGTAYRCKMLPVLEGRLDDYVFTALDNPNKFRPFEEDFVTYGELLTNQMIEKDTDATAVACFNDDIAISMIRHLHRVGKHVPDDISVAGIDDIKIGSFIEPPLTTVALSPYEQGRECVRVLLDMVAGKKIKRRTKIPLHLVERKSVSVNRR